MHLQKLLLCQIVKAAAMVDPPQATAIRPPPPPQVGAAAILATVLQALVGALGVPAHPVAAAVAAAEHQAQVQVAILGTPFKAQ